MEVKTLFINSTWEEDDYSSIRQLFCIEPKEPTGNPAITAVAFGE